MPLSIFLKKLIPVIPVVIDRVSEFLLKKDNQKKEFKLKKDRLYQDGINEQLERGYDNIEQSRQDADRARQQGYNDVNESRQDTDRARQQGYNDIKDSRQHLYQFHERIIKLEEESFRKHLNEVTAIHEAKLHIVEEYFEYKRKHLEPINMIIEHVVNDGVMTFGDYARLQPLRDEIHDAYHQAKSENDYLTIEIASLKKEHTRLSAEFDKIEVQCDQLRYIKSDMNPERFRYELLSKIKVALDYLEKINGNEIKSIQREYEKKCSDHHLNVIKESQRAIELRKFELLIHIKGVLESSRSLSSAANKLVNINQLPLLSSTEQSSHPRLSQAQNIDCEDYAG